MVKHHGKFVSYLRVSTRRQGESGLGLEGQRAAVAAWLNGGDWVLVEEHVEVESGKRADNRPALAKAFDACRAFNAKLVIAKLDRLSRDPVFLLSLRDAGIEFIAVDMPHANRLTVGIMALVAEQEREAISQRTKAALAAARARGTKLGKPKGTAVPRSEVGRAHSVRTNMANAEAFAEPVRPVREAHGGFGMLAMQGKFQPSGRSAAFRAATVEGRSPPAPFDLMRLPLYQQADERTRMRLVRAWQTPGWHVLVRQMQLRNI
jgi:DNA invertase Pin-like site-specific DNA recombinase